MVQSFRMTFVYAAASVAAGSVTVRATQSPVRRIVFLATIASDGVWLASAIACSASPCTP